MIDPAKRFRDAGASEELAAALAKSEQELIGRVVALSEDIITAGYPKPAEADGLPKGLKPLYRKSSKVARLERVNDKLALQLAALEGARTALLDVVRILAEGR